MDEWLKELYGSSKAKPPLFAESAAQLRLEAAATNGHASTPSAAPAVARMQQPPSGLAARMQPAGGVPSSIEPALTAPQAETRSANGQRRLTAMPLQPSGNSSTANRITPQAITAAPQSTNTRLHPSQPAQAASITEQEATPVTAAMGSKRKAMGSTADGSQPTKRLTAERLDWRPSALHPLAGAADSPGKASRAVLLSSPAPEPLVTQQLHAGNSDEAQLMTAGQGSGSIVLAAANHLTSGVDRATAELECTCSGKQVWTDRVSGCVVRIAGSQNYAAVGLQDGSLQVPLSITKQIARLYGHPHGPCGLNIISIEARPNLHLGGILSWPLECLKVYTPAGRRLLPAMQLGSAPVFLASDGGWKLLAVSQLGFLHLWDLKEQRMITESSVEPLLRLSQDPPHVTGSHVLQIKKPAC